MVKNALFRALRHAFPAGIPRIGCIVKNTACKAIEQSVQGIAPGGLRLFNTRPGGSKALIL